MDSRSRINCYICLVDPAAAAATTAEEACSPGHEGRHALLWLSRPEWAEKPPTEPLLTGKEKVRPPLRAA
jgi:hypothetical protein